MNATKAATLSKSCSGINLGPSADVRRHVLGLYLLHLLVEARIGELHCEVEGLQPGDAASPFIAFPLALETYLMEGSYNKVRRCTRGYGAYSKLLRDVATDVRIITLPHVQILAARASAPSPLYAAFMNRLTAAVRDDIADCAAAAYETLSVAAAQRMFKFESQREIVDYIAQQRVSSQAILGVFALYPLHPSSPILNFPSPSPQPDWHVADGIISFSASRQSNQDAKAVSQGGVAGDVTQRLLSYALEIERII